MADASDKESKTEEATPRKLDNAIEKGNTPVSREVAPFFTTLGVSTSIYLVAATSGGPFVQGLAVFIDSPADISLESSDDAAFLLAAVARNALQVTIPSMLVIGAFGVTAAAVQNPLRLTLQRIRPEFARLSPGSGLKRIFGLHGQVEFLKAVAKLVALTLVVLGFLLSHRHESINLLLLNPSDLPAALARQVVNLLLLVAAFLAVLAAADVLWSRFKWHRDLRMTRQEVKDEQKQSDGDPIIKARQRSLSRDRARRRMMATVPRATVVIANPTHYAVALRYVRGEQATPLVLAKGLDNIALKIRSIAEEHGIPVIEDRALARSLHDAVLPDRPIPPEFYRAVAEVILVLMTKNSGPPPAGAPIVGVRSA